MSTPRETAPTFDALADAIMYRWSVERDTWVSPREIAQARAYLRQVGVPTHELPDGRFTVDGVSANAVEAAELILLSLQHLRARRYRTS